ncbi:MAG: hypothetical protein GWO38_27405, partial [Phycisphaerae bacterium]|nr:hypothetical protein [Phycisphaerae bacterium]NIW99950.1 hypothetical protein [Phycisphaerae bacterium]NIX31251.1 hypothetical protein [Phycisphaerae bacterium]
MESIKSLRPFSFCVIALVILLSGCSGSEERQAEYLSRAKEHFEAGNLDKARIEAKNVLQINPKNAEGRYYLGLIAEKDQNFREAFGNFKAAAENDPKHVRALNKLTEYYAASKNYENAKEMAKKAQEVEADNADT